MGVCACQHCHGLNGEKFDDQMVWTSDSLVDVEMVSVNGADVDADSENVEPDNRLRPEHAIIGRWTGDQGVVAPCSADTAFCAAKFEISQWTEAGTYAYDASGL